MNKNMEEYEIYKLFNQMVIDESEFDDIAGEVSEIQKEQIRKHLHKKMGIDRISKKKTYKRKSLILVAAVLTFTVATISFAGNDIISGLKTNIYEVMGFDDENPIKNFKSVIGKSIEKDGVTCTLEDVLICNDSITVKSTFKSDEFKKYVPGESSNSEIFPIVTIKSTDKTIKQFTICKDSNLEGIGTSTEKINNDTYSVLCKYSMRKSMNLKGDLNVKVIYDKPDITGEKVLNELWDFDITVSKDKLVSEAKIIPIDKEITINTGKQVRRFKFKNLNLDSLSAGLEFTDYYNGEKENMNKKINENMLTKADDFWINAETIHFIVQDQTGKKIANLSYQGNSDAQHINMEYVAKYSVDAKKTTKLKVIPVLMGKIEKPLDEYAFEINIK